MKAILPTIYNAYWGIKTKNNGANRQHSIFEKTWTLGFIFREHLMFVEKRARNIGKSFMIELDECAENTAMCASHFLGRLTTLEQYQHLTDFCFSLKKLATSEPLTKESKDTSIRAHRRARFESLWNVHLLQVLLDGFGTFLLKATCLWMFSSLRRSFAESRLIRWTFFVQKHVTCSCVSSKYMTVWQFSHVLW